MNPTEARRLAREALSIVDEAIAAIDSIAADAEHWYCESHPEHLMGHDGCGGAGVLECARIPLLANQLRLAKQEARETAKFRDDIIRRLETKLAADADADADALRLPPGWVVDTFEVQETGVVELGTRNEDGVFYGFIRIDTDIYFQPEAAEGIARAIIDALARPAPAQAVNQQLTTAQPDEALRLAEEAKRLVNEMWGMPAGASHGGLLTGCEDAIDKLAALALAAPVVKQSLTTAQPDEAQERAAFEAWFRAAIQWGSAEEHDEDLCREAWKAARASLAPRAQPDEDAARLDYITKHRAAVIPEFQCGWDVSVYGDSSEPRATFFSGNTPRQAIDAARAQQGDKHE